MATTKEKQKQYSKQYYLQHREQVIERNTKYYRENKIKYLDYMREYNKKYYLEHKSNWNIRYNNMSLEEKQKKRKKYYTPKNKIIETTKITNKEPNFLISFN